MKKITVLLMLLAAFVSASAQDSLSLYEKGTFISEKGDTVPYRLLKPENPVAGEKYPLVVFMHGAGERGNDNERQLIHGANVWLNPVNRLDRPAYVLMPQCAETKYWAYPERPASFQPDKMPVNEQPTPIIEAVMELVGSIANDSGVDRDRIYVMGLSMGGMAVYDMAIRYPDIFAAAVPICGSVNASRIDSDNGVAFRIYHGDADPIVPVEGSRAAYRALRSNGATVEYVEFPGVGHDSWYPAFTDSALIPWLFSQHK